MRGPTYPAARAVAESVRAHFAACHATARERGEEDLGPAPDEATIEQIATAAFWTSLRREEGRSPRISLAYLSPAHAGDPLTLGRRLPLEPGVLTRLAPAVERPGIHLGVWHDESGLYVWGATRAIPPSCFVLEVVEPGLLVIKRRRGPEGGKYANVAVLQGDRIKLVDEGGDGRPERVPILAALLGFESPRSWVDPANVVVQLALSMRAHGHGGSLLVVPSRSEAWRRSIVPPIPYPVSPPFPKLAALLRHPPHQQAEAGLRQEVRQAVDAIAGLTAVDGATVIDEEYNLLGFGVRIGRSADAEPIQRVRVIEPAIGSRSVEMEVAELGGTRHLSAAQFVHEQRDALALVASQDGRFTAFGWPPGEEMLHAHRVETLLL